GDSVPNGRWRAVEDMEQVETRNVASPRSHVLEGGPPCEMTMSEREGYFLAFGGTILSLAALATRNLTTVLAGILIASPVAGFRPLRALRLALTSLPIPGKVNAPVFFV